MFCFGKASNRKMRILIIAHFTSGVEEKGNCRFHYLAKKLAERGHEVELVTSSFSHIKKVQRKQNERYPYTVTYIYEPNYQKNVSLKRLISHHKIGKNLKKHFKEKREKPEVIYCSVPSLNVSYEAGKYAERNHIPFIIDVQDLWPEAFEMVMPFQTIGKIIFRPMKRKADEIYRMADEIIAVSKTYAARAVSVNHKVSAGHSVFLGTELSYFDLIAKQREKEELGGEYFRIVYIGTVGRSYNIKVIIDAMALLQEQGICDLEFLVMGDGPSLNECQEYAQRKNVRVIFTGRLPYDKMVQSLKTCQIAVNPIVHGAAQSIINKVGDYAVGGLPVINSQECPEYKELLQQYEAGINCRCDDSEDIANAIKRMLSDADLRTRLGKNSRKLGEQKFDRKQSYNEIIDLIEQR